MKRFLLMVLILSISHQIYAQGTPEVFNINSEIFTRKFFIELGKGDRMEIEVSHPVTLLKITNLDSIVRVFIRDIQSLKNNIGEELQSRRIDYVIDTSVYKKIRMQEYPTNASHYLVNSKTDDPALLKLEQDTVYIIGRLPGNGKKINTTQYYRVGFYLNDLNNLGNYVDGQFNRLVAEIVKNKDLEWERTPGGQIHLKNNTSVTAITRGGHLEKVSVFLLQLSVDVQNYKNYFVPSASVRFVITKSLQSIRREFGIAAETHFLFADNAAGKKETFPNLFVTASYGDAYLKEQVRPYAKMYQYFSIGYLVSNRGGIYEDNTFKVSLGRFSLFSGSTRIEPTFYFHDFLKKVTPSIRLTQNF